MRALLISTLLAAATTAPAAAQQLRQPKGHPDHGLPVADAAWLPYHADRAHVLNRIWRRLYLVRCVPKDVATALPREHGDEREYFVGGWYFGKRAGRPEDERLFGGDGRQLPVEGFDAARSAELSKWLGEVDGDVAKQLRARPRAAVWFQHDLLRLSRRLLDTEQNPELLAPLWRCALRVALPRDVLQSDALRTFALADVAAALPDFDPAQSVEVARRSSRLFDAQWVQLWSTIHVQFPGRSPDETLAWITAEERAEPLPLHGIAVLQQGIVAVDERGESCATSLAIEARVQRLQNRDPLSFDNDTTTRDGVDFAMWSLARRTVRDLKSDAKVPFAALRSIDMNGQELFRDYGTRKHTTYAAQCALCHRRTHGPDEELAGFSALRTTSKPRRAEPGERQRLAEVEMQRFVDELRAR